MALSNDAVVLVLKALKGITGNPDQCFTAYDVTKATRSLTEDNIRHHDVREVIHTFYDQGFLNLYDRQSHSFWSDTDQDYRAAQLFVPPNGDPNSYNPDEVQMVKDDGDSDGQVLLQDSSGNALITVGTVPALPLVDPVTDSAEEVEDSVVVNVVVNDAAPAPVAAPMQTATSVAPTKPQRHQRPTSLFDLIKKGLTKLRGLWDK
jgi:hypothetical protein